MTQIERINPNMNTGDPEIERVLALLKDKVKDHHIVASGNTVDGSCFSGKIWKINLPNAIVVTDDDGKEETVPINQIVSGSFKHSFLEGRQYLRP